MDDDLRDRLDLAALVQRYAVLVDARAWPDLVDLFAPDAVLVSPDPPRSLLPVREALGHDGIRDAMGALGGLVRTVHHVTGHVLDTLSPTEATGRTTGVAHHVTETGDGLRDVVWHVSYRDTFRRDDEWVFARREVTIDLLETRPVARARPQER